jgi:hypothetical protein
MVTYALLLRYFFLLGTPLRFGLLARDTPPLGLTPWDVGPLL